MAADLCGQNNQTAESLPHDVFFWEAPQGLKRGHLRVIQTQQRWSSEEEKPRQSEVRKIEKVRGKTEVELITSRLARRSSKSHKPFEACGVFTGEWTLINPLISLLKLITPDS